MRPLHLLLCSACATLLTTPAISETLTIREKQRNANAKRFVYEKQVPHVTRTGKRLMQYAPEQSFFPIGLWGVPLPGTAYGTTYDWGELKNAGYNTVWPYHSNPETSLAHAKEAGLQIVQMINPDDKGNPDSLKNWLPAVKDDPHLLGIVWMDEPIGHLIPGYDMEGLFQNFLRYKEAANRIAPDLPVFINDAPWIMNPATSWWIKWNTGGDLSCHDNYPAIIREHNLRSVNLEPNGIVQSVSLAVGANKEEKPVWLIVGAFEQTPNLDYPTRFCSPPQLRSQIYAGIINGATGIIYFIWDSYISREAGCVGMAPNPVVNPIANPGEGGAPPGINATPMQMVQSKALWETAAVVNQEINQIAPSILAPTVADVDYQVSVKGKAVTDTPIQCLLKPSPDGGYLLITVNTDDAVLDVGYTFPDSLKAAERMFEKLPPFELSEDKRSFNIRYEPFATHIIHLKPAGTQPRTASTR